MDTIVALSSGRPPAAIAVLRLSGRMALSTASQLAGPLPPPRRAGLRMLRDGAGELLDRALVLVFPGPESATGEDLVEFHCHGGRAVVEAVETAVLAVGGRRAAPGEFTRRALLNGRIDLAEAEGLADLLEAETDAQRRSALMASEGVVSRAIRAWLDRVIDMAARLEASLDFAEEGDVVAEGDMLRAVCADAAALRRDIGEALIAPPVERLRDGIRVVIAGPPNSGKSTLLNLMAQREAAIVSPHAGTTRDRVEAPVQRAGVAYLLTDTAGLNDAADPVERIGVVRAHEAIANADLVLWLGDEPPPRPGALWVQARADIQGRERLLPGRQIVVRQDRLDLVDALWRRIADLSAGLLPEAGTLPLKAAQRCVCASAADQLVLHNEALVAAEQLRLAAKALGSVLGIDATEAMLDALFRRFCLGK